MDWLVEDRKKNAKSELGLDTRHCFQSEIRIHITMSSLDSLTNLENSESTIYFVKPSLFIYFSLCLQSRVSWTLTLLQSLYYWTLHPRYCSAYSFLFSLLAHKSSLNISPNLEIGRLASKQMLLPIVWKRKDNVWPKQLK